MQKLRHPSVAVVFLTVFIDLVGFGIVVPMVPVFSRHLGAEGLMIGVAIAAFSAMQFVFSPVWGRLSDRYGRRPILLISTAGAAVSYALFAWSCGLGNSLSGLYWMIFSRALAGACGGNITVAYAYIADLTLPEQRSRKMGLLGMAFGLGFVFGPFIGGVSLHHLGPTGPGWVAAGMCAANLLLASLVLGESRKPGTAPAPHRPHLKQWTHTLAQPKVGLLVVLFFFTTFVFSCFESTLPLIVADNFGLDYSEDARVASKVAYLFVYCGLIGAFVQGGAIGYLVKRLGEARLILWSLILTAISFAVLPFIKGSSDVTLRTVLQPHAIPFLLLLAALGLLSVGTSLTRPPLFGLLSNLTSAEEQGATLGVAQAAGSLARIIGPLFATTLLEVSASLPYLLCAGLLAVLSVILARKLGGASSPGAPTPSP